MPTAKVMGVPLSTNRREVIFALYNMGGTLEKGPDERGISREKQDKLLKMGTMALASMERDGIITRDVVGKNTHKLSLTPQWSKWASETEPPKRRGPYKRSGKPRKMTTRGGGKRVPRARKAAHGITESLPQIGSSLTVFLVQQYPDGTLHVGLRDDNQSWLTLIEGQTERV